ITRGEGVRRGTALAAGFKNVCYSHGFDDYSTARVRLVRERGEPVAYVLTAAAEVGQGIVLVCEQIARSVLEVQRVVVETPNTSIDSAGSSSASRQTWMSGGAVLAACREVRIELERRAKARGRALEDFEVADLLDEPIERTVKHRHRPTEARNDTTQNSGHVAFLFAAHRATVAVDVETGPGKVVQVPTSTACRSVPTTTCSAPSRARAGASRRATIRERPHAPNERPRKAAHSPIRSVFALLLKVAVAGRDVLGTRVVIAAVGVRRHGAVVVTDPRRGHVSRLAAAGCGRVERFLG